MTVDPKVAERLKLARERAGYAAASNAAEAMNIKVARYLHHENGTRGLARGSDVKYSKFFGVSLEWLLTGQGPMKKGQLIEPEQQAPLPPPNVDLADAKPVPWVGQMPEDVPVYGVAVGGADGDFSLNGEIVERVKRPPGIAGNRSAFAIYVRGESMEPRHYQGDLLYVNPLRPARAGDDVLVELKPLRGGDSGVAYVKQLVSQTPVRIVLRQFNPEKEITLPADRVKAVSKILGLAELLVV